MKPANRPKMIATLAPFFATLTPSSSISDVGNYLDFPSAQDDVAAGLLGGDQVLHGRHPLDRDCRYPR